MQRSIDFAPLIRLAGYSWREVEEVMWFSDFDQTTVVRPTLTDYISLDPKLREILYDLTFPPTIYKLSVTNEKFLVHIAAAREVADILEVELPDRCLEVLWENMLKQAEVRGSLLRDTTAIENLGHRVALLARIGNAIDALEDCGSSLDMKSQYFQYIEDNSNFLTEDEYRDWVVSDCLNLIREVIRTEEQYVNRQLDRACQFYGCSAESTVAKMVLLLTT